MTDDAPFIKLLLAWYMAQAADLPWRRTDDPYRIWLSEIMLQQTQVATVIPYYERFLEQFPTVAALAEADQDTVLKAWEGLGYYSRARHLHAAARQVMDAHDGRLPRNAAGLQKLKGIGPYTAGAIASIAFGEPAPVVDGNVIRVFTRLFDINEDVTRSATRRQLWDKAGALMAYVPEGRAGDYNQALMELGREICTPRQPDCQACPVNAHCQAYARDVQDERPVKKKKPPTPHYNVTCGLIRDEQERLLIAKRPDDALLGGLWEFPGGKQEDGESLQDCLKRELREELDIAVAVGPLFIKVDHAYTHFKITLHAFECTYLPEGGPPRCQACTDFAWVTLDDLDNYAFSRADRHIIEALHARPGMLL